MRLLYRPEFPGKIDYGRSAEQREDQSGFKEDESRWLASSLSSPTWSRYYLATREARRCARNDGMFGPFLAETINALRFNSLRIKRHSRIRTTTIDYFVICILFVGVQDSSEQSTLLSTAAYSRERTRAPQLCKARGWNERSATPIPNMFKGWRILTCQWPVLPTTEIEEHLVSNTKRQKEKRGKEKLHMIWKVDRPVGQIVAVPVRACIDFLLFAWIVVIIYAEGK